MLVGRFEEKLQNVVRQIENISLEVSHRHSDTCISIYIVLYAAREKIFRGLVTLYCSINKICEIYKTIAIKFLFAYSTTSLKS